MSHKTMVRWAIVILVAFIATIVIFPMAYNPVESTAPANEPMPVMEVPNPPPAE